MYASTLQACAASYAWIGSAISTNLTLFYTDWNAQQGNTNMFFVSICFQMFYLGTNLTFLMIFDIEVHLTSRSVAIARTLQTFAACPIGAINLVSTNLSPFKTSCCKNSTYNNKQSKLLRSSNIVEFCFKILADHQKKVLR